MNRFVTTILLIFFSIGCSASGPGFKDTQFATQPLPDGKGRIIFYRESDINFRSVTIGIEGAAIGALAHKGFIVADIAPDDYKISAWMRGIPLGEFVLKLRVSAGETYYIRASHRDERTAYPLFGPLGVVALFADTRGEFRLDQVTAAVALPTLEELKLSE